MTTVLKKDAYKILKKEIDDRGIKNKFIANKIGVSPSYLSQVLNGSKKLSTDVAIKVIQVLDLPLNIFLNES
ncbi:helix-turn-helix domain-containing protein [Limosilactobacillus reuteri]|uniref:helix-turn-helix transcriptional regulator n=1 Tax=Limosilactobacillus TaxID=2742598 RepID=UPI00129B1706|nr:MULTISPECIES: helix-turn-helix transcriptional regulator [Limosilactobacillus]MBB1100010.1 helix-turn-helix transcriptional regulator [Limosilactobacillus agrestis]MCC4347674.1 helix-turn-helix domain-containing protein [Limosilactobacillus reuteri]MCC4385950.1 helix-turn-helix domain-containing protein [Limosilactobacillus reuteri]MCD7123697.1 helix-turn-helix domain-containing protein [Limosilactobacillus caviae]MCD7127410.1 helix-turn-helix domain-containing protein [Limosilactobacillus 